MNFERGLILGAAAILVACGGSEVPATSSDLDRLVPIEIASPGQVPKHAEIEIPGCSVTRNDELQLTLRALCTTDPGLFFKVEERKGDPKAPGRILHNEKAPGAKLVDRVECCTCVGPLKPDAEAVFLNTWVDGHCASPSRDSASSAKFSCDLKRGRVDEKCCDKRKPCVN